MTNVSESLQLRLVPAQIDLLRRLSASAGRKGARIYLVGGTVRDVLVGVPHLDLDIMYLGGGTRFPDVVAQETGGIVDSHTDFGTAKLFVDGLEVDLAAARNETYDRPGALPRVLPGTIVEDAARRDFSINAMAVSLMEETWGELDDPHGGLEDLHRGVVRALHNKSFVDDPTRILRAVRYVGRLGFHLSPETDSWLKRDIHCISYMSGDRIRHELERIFRERKAIDILRMAAEWGILAAVHPAWQVDTSLLEKHRALAVAPGQQSPVRMFALVAYSIDEIALDRVIDRIRPDNPCIKAMRDVHSLKAKYVDISAAGLLPADLYFMLHKLDLAAIEVCSSAVAGTVTGDRLYEYLVRLRHIRPQLNGNDVQRLGVQEGPEVGRLLHDLMVARLNGVASSREEEIKLVREHLAASELHN